MQTIYPAGSWRPLGTQTEPSIGTPRVLIFHTMVGNLGSTDSMFRQGGYTGTESTFGVGGPWETPNRDGVVWQWQDLTHQADAQWDGNAYATSIETADGGNPNHPWTDKQLDALVKLATWWCKQTGHPARMVDSVSQAGFGYHAQFSVWNKSAHSCPGTVRIGQLVHTIVPAVAKALNAPPVTPPAKFTLTRYLRLENPMMIGKDVAACQGKVGCGQDGVFGPVTRDHVISYQKTHKLSADGIVGPDTAKSFGWNWAG